MTSSEEYVVSLYKQAIDNKIFTALLDLPTIDVPLHDMHHMRYFANKIEKKQNYLRVYKDVQVIIDVVYSLSGNYLVLAVQNVELISSINT